MHRVMNAGTLYERERNILNEENGAKLKKEMKVSVPDLKRALKSYDHDVLISMMVECYQMSDVVKNYIHVLLNPEAAVNDLYLKTQQVIFNEFFPVKGYAKLRLAQAKKAITEFKKYSRDEVKTLDLMIYYVEVGVEFTDTYGDINERFYASMETMYESVLKKMDGEDRIVSLFKDRLKSIVDKTSGMGWGFHDYLAGVYYTYINDDEEEAEEL